MISLTLRGLSQHRLRTFLTAMAIVIGVALVSASFTVSDTMKHGADSLSASAYGGTDAVVTGRSDVKRTDIEQAHVQVPASAVDRASDVPGVALATGSVLQEAKIDDGHGGVAGNGPFFGVGLDARTRGAASVTPFHLVGGRWASGPGEVVLDQGTAEDQHLQIGDSVRIAGRGPARPYRVSGTVRFGTLKSLGKATVSIFDLPTAQADFGAPGKLDEVLVKAEPGVAPATLRARLAERLGPGVAVKTAAADDRFTLDSLKQFISILGAVLLGFGIVSIVVAAATIFNALSITVAQRTRDLALLRMLGADRAQVRRSLFAEAAIIGVGASAVGIPVGYVLALGLTSALASLGVDLPHAGLAFGLGSAAVAVAIGVGATLLAAVVPARRAGRSSPLAALRDSGDGGSAAARGGRARRTVGRGVAGLVSILGRPGEKLAGIAGVLARRNAMRNPGRTGATAAALAIGVTLVVGVATLSAALERATEGEARAAVGSGLVLADAEWGPFSAGAAARVAAAPGVRAVAPVRQGEAQAFGRRVEVDGVSPRATAAALRYDWVAGSQTTLARMTRSSAVVERRWAEEHRLRVGSSFALRAPDGDRLPLTVAGVVDRPALNPLGLGEVTITQGAFVRAFPRTRPSLAFIDAPGVSAGALESRVSGFPGLKVLSARQYADHAADPFRQLLAIFEVLLALAVIASLFGIVNTMVLSVLERTRELGLMRAAGMSRRQVRRMVRQESIITALVGAAVGIVLGLGLGALAVSLLPVDGLSVAFPGGAIVTTVIVAIECGVLAAVLPARRAARMDVLAAVSHA